MKGETPSAKRLQFAKYHGYKYIGNGWFLPVDPVATIGDFVRITDFTIHDIINLKQEMIGLCRKHNVHLMVYILKRIKEKHI